MERKTHRLTAKQVEGAKDGWHADGGNLFLRVADGGRRKHWVLRWTRDGKTTEMGLGPAGGAGNKVSLALARQKRDEAMQQISNGLHPIAERRKAKDAKASRKTFAEAAAAVIKARQTGWRESQEGRKSSLEEWTKNLTVDCQPIGAKFVDELDVNDIKRVVSPFWDAGFHNAARRMLNRIELVIEYALAHGWRSADNPASWKRFQHIAPAQPKNGETRHHAAMPWRDVPGFMRRLREIEAMAALALEFAILTATRSGEARGAQWSEIDFDKATWTIGPERMKANREFAVPLSNAALRLLSKMEAVRADDFVFPGDDEGVCISNKTVWEMTKRLAPDVTSHGFRSSFRDWCGDHGVEREVAELCLAHSIGNATEQAYNRTKMLERRRPVMEDWGRFLDGETDSAKVVPLKRA
jgi:integrase